jgi:hypothetical protein
MVIKIKINWEQIKKKYSYENYELDKIQKFINLELNNIEDERENERKEIEILLNKMNLEDRHLIFLNLSHNVERKMKIINKELFRNLDYFTIKPTTDTEDKR